LDHSKKAEKEIRKNIGQELTAAVLLLAIAAFDFLRRPGWVRLGGAIHSLLIFISFYFLFFQSSLTHMDYKEGKKTYTIS
jgi:hypothetical protein